MKRCLNNSDRFVLCEYHALMPSEILKNKIDVTIPSYLDMETGALIPQNDEDSYTIYMEKANQLNGYIFPTIYQFVTFDEDKLPHNFKNCSAYGESLEVCEFVPANTTYNKENIPCVMAIAIESCVRNILEQHGWEVRESGDTYHFLAVMSGGFSFTLPFSVSELTQYPLDYEYLYKKLNALHQYALKYDAELHAKQIMDVEEKICSGIFIDEVLDDCNEYKERLISVTEICLNKWREIYSQIQHGTFRNEFEKEYNTYEKQFENIKEINDIQAFARYNVEEALLDYEQQKGLDYESLTYIEDTRHRYEVVEWLIQNEGCKYINKDKLDWVKLFTDNKDYIEYGENLAPEIKEHIQRKASGLQYKEVCKMRVQEAVKREYHKIHKQYSQELLHSDEKENQFKTKNGTYENINLKNLKMCKGKELQKEKDTKNGLSKN